MICEEIRLTAAKYSSSSITLLPFDKTESDRVYVLQKWSEKWKEYLDVSDSSEIATGDKLNVFFKQEKGVS